jgi:hypothetical protein
MFTGKKKKQKENNLIIETLSFLNQKIDNIVGKSDLINELLEEIDDPVIIESLNKKLAVLEKELDHIGSKIDLEKQNLKNAK